MKLSIPGEETSREQLTRLQSNHTCREACTGTVQCGPDLIQLKCPLTQLDPTISVDRKIIQTVYKEAYER